MTLSNEARPENGEINQDTDPRQVEVFALREIAQRLMSAQVNPGDEAGMLQAVRLNWRLWTIFQTSMLDNDCQLPIEIRNNIFSLSNFVDKHTANIIEAPAPSKLDVLIRINHDLADGLSGAAFPNPQP